MSKTLPEPGRVVLLREQHGLACGLVLRARKTGARSERTVLELLTDSDRTVRLTGDRVLLDLGRTLHPGDRRSELVARLRDIHARIREASEGLDLAELWELLVDEVQGPHPWQTLAEYYLESSDAEKAAVFLEAIHRDRIHFRAKKDGFFELRTRQEVEQLLQQRRREETRARQRADFVARARQALQSGAGQVAVVAEDEPWLELLKGLALHGEAFPKHAEAAALLREIGTSRGRPEHTAFELLAALGVWAEDEELCLLRHNVPTEFSARVLAAAEALPRFEASTPGYRDLSALAFVAIDDAETTERDDALAFDPEAGAAYVAIANPAEFVAPGDVLDRAAIQRGRTIYLPRRKLLMLPPALSEDRASLTPEGIRPALVFRLQLDGDGHLASWDLFLGAVRLARTLTYGEVDRLLAGEDAGDETVQALRHLHRLAQGLRQARLDRGALVLDSPEVKVRVAGDGTISVRRISVDTASHLLVSEFMILVNHLAASYCLERDLPCVFVSQDEPDEPLPPREAFPSDRTWFHVVRHRLRRAQVGTVPARHAALGLEVYCQASSPLRRYSDLQNVMQITHHLKTGGRLLTAQQMQEAAATAEQSAVEASLCERETKRYWLLKYLEARVGQPMEAEVVAMDHDGTHLLELCETLLTFRMPPAGLSLGQRLLVVPERVDARRDVFVARLAGEPDPSAS